MPFGSHTRKLAGADCILPIAWESPTGCRWICMYLFPGKPQSAPSDDAYVASLGSQNKATRSGTWDITLQGIPEKA